MLPFNSVAPIYAKALSHLHAACFSKSWDEKDFSSLLCLPTTKGYMNEEAFILLSVCGDEAEILTIGVVPVARRKNIAFSLLEHTIKCLKEQGISCIFLEVDVENIAARRLYEKSGFSQVAIRKNYYVKGDKKTDAFVLKKQI